MFDIIIFADCRWLICWRQEEPRQIALWVAVDENHFESFLGKRRAEIYRRRRLADAAFEIVHSDDLALSSFRPRNSRQRSDFVNRLYGNRSTKPVPMDAKVIRTFRAAALVWFLSLLQ